MTTEKKHIALLEQLLHQSRQDKLMYLNTADNQDLPLFKRFFNQQAIVRNKMFNDFNLLLSQLNVDVDAIMVKRSDIRQFMVTTPKREKNNPFNRCLKQDLLLKKQLEAILAIDKIEANHEIYRKQLAKIKQSIATNELHGVDVKYNAVTRHDLV